MKRINVILALVVAALVIVGLYFYIGTGMKVHAASAAQEGGVRCELTLSNGSLFQYEYLEFIVLAPDGAQLISAESAGADVPRLSQHQATVEISLDEVAPFQLEIGYYVMGMRKSVTLWVD